MNGQVRADTELDDGGWTKEYRFLWWSLLVRSGSYDNFLESQFSMLGYTVTHTYSKALWVLLNIAGLVLLVFGSLLFILIGALSADGIDIFMEFGLVVLVCTLIYGYVFYRLTFTPPHSREKGLRVEVPAHLMAVLIDIGRRPFRHDIHSREKSE